MRRRVRQGTLFELHVGMQVDLRRVGGCVTEPEGDHAEVDATTEQRHGRGVAQRVGLHVLGGERGARAPCGGDMSRHEPLKCIGAPVSTAYAWEDRVARLSALFDEPLSEYGDDI